VSFRGRLTVFFVLIVVVPIVAVAFLVIAISGSARNGKADARLAVGVHTALATYRRELAHARQAATAIARDPALQQAVSTGDPGAIRAAAESARLAHGIRELVVRGPDGAVRAGPGESVPIARVRRTGGSGAPAATVSASTTAADAFVDRVAHLTGLDVAVVRGSRPAAATVPLRGVSMPPTGGSSDVTAAGRSLRATTARLPGAGGLELAMLGPVPAAGVLSSKPLVAAAVAAFLALALLLVALVMRALSGQVSAMLAAARRLGRGDFGGEVPVVGDDEMAGLAQEFNKMSDRLTAQMDQLRHQRDEIERSVRRIGEAFALGLDRKAMLGIVADTAISACNATYGVVALSGRLGDEAETGAATTALRDAAVVAEERAARAGGIADHEDEAAFALSSPIVRLGNSETIGVMSIARSDRAFDRAERDVFRYLVGQAATSIENIALHELVSEQAITDDLTGLSNKRRFREFVVKEAARAERFSHPMSLLMVDLDEFKRVNDLHGHLTGDEVLRRVARILDSERRWVDEAARYGGEEFAVALPETDLAGARGVAERIRRRLADERIATPQGAAAIRVTTSIGVASIPRSASGAEALIAAADAALYEAKRAGKNRVAAAAAGGDRRSARRPGPAGVSPDGGRAARRR
jgi:diguanylate cyclase (GGDEF)-like protein